MISDFNLILNFVILSEGISHDGNQHVEKMEHENECGNIEKAREDIALDVLTRVKT